MEKSWHQDICKIWVKTFKTVQRWSMEDLGLKRHSRQDRVGPGKTRVTQSERLLPVLLSALHLEHKSLKPKLSKGNANLISF